ncbi:hypothetical protein G7B40_016445 [Aetokthonos hydrillicola Thurmond2011]|jgi:hypothetical protein|uniref:Uncharacterized protein n=1 Tax=Aetokthonos hydrillicola Thurmond2011 TaxID=2712845 RepID=A0AAP5I6W6_9CYAN|nr:hypothetical protein [Aetokthonos hydrillicola]MBO3458769.1 hypothetical protein [Aetokthonos hydrillicola CCALA 1050]MBW4585516.1 hypothetical protein [Aetokthonos hydrillicola CCALA 1050]MDR9896138.1 hypothetical protein [Aetokthonos hydrillicola Thurmond2011]
MYQSVQYITNQQGERVGVVLDLETYHQLTNPSTADPEILNNLSFEELQALATSVLSPPEQTQLSDLLARNAQNELSSDETAILDSILAQVDQLNILKTRARYTLNKLKETSKLA